MEEIIKELHSLKLSGMARLWASLGETKRLDKLTLVDGIMLLLQAERDTRTTNRNNRLVKRQISVTVQPWNNFKPVVIVG